MKLARVYHGKSAYDHTFKVCAREGPAAVEAIGRDDPARSSSLAARSQLLGGALFLGEELAFAGRIAEAQREFEAVLRLKPDHPWAHLNLGVALFKQGRRAEAVRQFEEALRLDPQLLPAKRYLEQLNSQPSSNP